MTRYNLAFLLWLAWVLPVYGEPIGAIVDWADRLELGPVVGGTVVYIGATVGDRVQKGDDLMRIDPIPYEHTVAMREAELKASKARYESEQQEYLRQQELYEIGSLSTVSLQQSELKLTHAESDYLLAEAQHKLALYKLNQAHLKAPFDAWVIEKRVTVGQNLSTRQAIPISFVLAPFGSYIAVAKFDNSVNLPPIGSEVRVEVNGEEYTGKTLFPHVSNEQVTLRIQFSHDSLILPGTRANIVVTPQ